MTEDEKEKKLILEYGFLQRLYVEKKPLHMDDKLRQMLLKDADLEKAIQADYKALEPKKDRLGATNPAYIKSKS
jgi:hypothetical protein